MPPTRRRGLGRSLRPLIGGGAFFFALAGLACGGPTEIDRAGLRVVLISLDGLRPDAITAANMPTLVRLAKDGASTFKALTGDPSLTLPSHTSMVTGLVPLRHGIDWNDDTSGPSGPVGVPTIFDLATQAGFTTAMFVGKSKLSPLIHTGAPTKVNIPPVGALWKSDTVAAHVLGYLANTPADQRPSMMFIHIPDIDIAGHTYGWMSEPYLTTARHVDSTVASILQGLRIAFGDNLTVIVTADHGGEGTGHSDSSRPLARMIPWIASGRFVAPQVLTGDIRVVDVGPTMVWLLGITPPADWDGVPVKRAFPTLNR